MRTKIVKLVLIGGTTIFNGCAPTPSHEEHVVTTSDTHVYPTWWWWYIHRPYFSAPLYSPHIAHSVGGGSSYYHSSTSSYGSARSATGAKIGGGSVSAGGGFKSSSVSASGGFKGGNAGS